MDEWVVTHLAEYDGKSLKSVSKGNFDLGTLEDKDEKKRAEETAGEYQDLIARVRRASTRASRTCA